MQGAKDIISEMISDEAEFRKWIRNKVYREGIIESKGSSEEATPYEMYYDYQEAVRNIPSHRILDINRGEKEKILSVKVTIDESKLVDYLKGKCPKGNSTTDLI